LVFHPTRPLLPRPSPSTICDHLHAFTFFFFLYFVIRFFHFSFSNFVFFLSLFHSETAESTLTKDAQGHYEQVFPGDPRFRKQPTEITVAMTGKKM
jgi:hypothetical protein